MIAVVGTWLRIGAVAVVGSLLAACAVQPPARPPVDPALVIERVRDLLSRQGRLDDVRTDWTLDPDVPRVRAHVQRLEQVLVNLLLNALDALARTEDPWIGVRVRWEQGASLTRPSRREDDPPGINYAHRRRADGGGSTGRAGRRAIIGAVAQPDRWGRDGGDRLDRRHRRIVHGIDRDHEPSQRVSSVDRRRRSSDSTGPPQDPLRPAHRFRRLLLCLPPAPDGAGEPATRKRRPGLVTTRCRT